MSTVIERPVVVGVDGSDSATRAVRWASHEAVRRGAPLLLVHVWTPVPVGVPHAAMLGSYEDGLIDQGQRWLAEASAVAREAGPGLTLSSRLGTGSVAGHLIGASASAELVVVGSRGLGGFTGLLVGSTAVALAAHGQCPVVVVRGEAPPDGRGWDGPVVVGIDGSSAGEGPTRFAFGAADGRRVPLVVVHAWSDAPVTTTWELTTTWRTLQRSESARLTEYLAPWRERYPDVAVEQVVVRDSPVHALLEHARRAQLVVVGSRGRGGFRGLLLGSTSQAMIHHATCPVAVVTPVQP